MSEKDERESTSDIINRKRRKAVEPSSNVIYIGKRDGKIVSHDMIPTKRRNAMQVFKLPSGEIQLKGWYSEDAAHLIQAYPDQYKRVTSKGSK